MIQLLHLTLPAIRLLASCAHIAGILGDRYGIASDLVGSQCHSMLRLFVVACVFVMAFVAAHQKWPRRYITQGWRNHLHAVDDLSCKAQVCQPLGEVIGRKQGRWGVGWHGCLAPSRSMRYFRRRVDNRYASGITWREAVQALDVWTCGMRKRT